MDRHAEEVLQHEALQSLLESAVKSIVSISEETASVLLIWNFSLQWSLDIDNIYAEIRLGSATITGLLVVCIG